MGLKAYIQLGIGVNPEECPQFEPELLGHLVYPQGQGLVKNYLDFGLEKQKQLQH